jgi:putative YphP/YqiW family bacilliredoxin
MPYPELLVRPMREELTRLGVRELRTAADVEDAFVVHQGTTLVVVNSVCGCAARNARPAVAMALVHATKPDDVVTVFAGQDLEATAAARERFVGYAPSSPSIGLLKDGEPIYLMERYQIEGRTAEQIAADLTELFDRYCSAAV